MQEVSLVVVLLLFLVSNAFWLYHYNKLLNKFMCRNYHEFVAAENIKKEFEIPKPSQATEVPDGYEAERARQMNEMMGLV